ncbi:MAG: porin family protein [Bacteroidota bacterium]
MKKGILILLLMVISAVGFTQIKVGVKGGLNVSSYFFDPDPENNDIKALASFHLGGFLNYEVAENISIQAELLYSGEGGRLVGTGTDDTGLLDPGEVDTELRDKYSWLALPVLAKYSLSSGLTFEAGFAFNFLLSAETSFAVSDDNLEVALISDFNDSVKGLDTRFAIGAGYELASGLSFNGRYSFSLGNIYTQEYTDENNGLEGGLGVFQLSVGFPIYAK